MTTSTCGASEIDAANAELGRRSLRDYIEIVWPVVEPGTVFVPGWHLDAICEHLEAVTSGQIRNLLLNMPPRHMKSLAVSVFWPTWEWIEHPERRWMFASYAERLSIRDSLKCRRIIESPLYQRLWGDRFKLVGDQNEKRRFENDKTGYRLSTSVGGAATGEGGDRIVADDPHNVKDRESDAVLESTWVWWSESMSTRLNDPKTGAKVIIMQRVGDRDLSGRVLQQGGYEHLCLPAEYEGENKPTIIGWSDPRTAFGQLLWEERFGRAELDALKKELGSQGTAGQLQQRPSPAGGGILKRHWWRYWKYPKTDLPAVKVRLSDGTWTDVHAVELPDKFDTVIQSWDMAFKDLSTSDYVVGQVQARLAADRFILDQSRGRMDLPATLDAVRTLTKRHPSATLKLVEDKANGPAVVQSLRHEIAGLVEVNPEGGKISRAYAVSPEVEAGNWYVPHPDIAPWVKQFLDETEVFPNGANDDQVDAWSQGGNRLRQMGGGIRRWYEQETEKR